ncbi:MAG: hypothetical protein F4X02_11295 [Chloroflexi bacterium]|nr:hypothetical protein [Chloroflexota bacterium]
MLQAEPLANLLLACAFVSAMAQKRAKGPKTIAGLGLLTGGLIALSALARPAAYLLWIPMALWIAIARPRWRLIAAATLALAGLLGAGLWINHNAMTYGHRSFSTIGNYNLLYYRAASVMHQATGEDITDVYAELARRVEAEAGNDATEITAMQRHTHYARTTELQAAMTKTAIEIMLRNPVQYVATLPVGLLRVLLQVSGPLNWIGLLWNAVLLAAVGVGLGKLARQSHWADMAFLLLPCGYFIAGTLLVQTSGIDTRARVMVTPLLAIMAAQGLMYLLNRRRAASASPSPRGGS